MEASCNWSTALHSIHSFLEVAVLYQIHLCFHAPSSSDCLLNPQRLIMGPLQFWHPFYFLSLLLSGLDLHSPPQVLPAQAPQTGMACLLQTPAVFKVQLMSSSLSPSRGICPNLWKETSLDPEFSSTNPGPFYLSQYE